MNVQLGLIQILNGLQFGILLFLVSAGLTLLLGIMNFVNLAHGSMYMVAAYIAAQLFVSTGSFIVAAVGAVLFTFLLGVLIDVICLRTMYERNHLDQVLVTYGLLLFFNETVRMIWGPGALAVPMPDALSRAVDLGFGITYPAYRLFIIGVGLFVAVAMSLVITWTRVGMIIRAAATHRTMTSAMGVNVSLLSTLVFATGSALAGLAGVIAAPLLSVQSGMGDPILILALVVIVIGGIGSVRGALFGSVLVGMVDTIGRAYLPQIFVALVKPSIAQAIGPAVASILIYLLMAAVLIFRPQGLLAVRGRKS